MSAEELRASEVQAAERPHDTCFDFIEACDTRVTRTDQQIRKIPSFDHTKAETSYAAATDIAKKRIT
jgi:hypothetical protein